MPRRGRLWLFFGAVLVLLLLSALVETGAGDEAEAGADREWSAALEVAALPDRVLVQEDTAAGPLAAQAARLMIFSVFLAVPLVAAGFFCRGANGRWLRKKRYVDSVYEVFRQETACG